jgi:four helix bundle protein
MVNGRFQELRVYKPSEKLADNIWKIVQKWESLPQNTIGKQIIRSADSIGANISEGVRRGSYQENRRFIKIARGSLYKTQHWLRRAYSRNLLTDEEINTPKAIIKDLAPQLNAYLNSIGQSPKQSQIMTNYQ